MEQTEVFDLNMYLRQLKKCNIESVASTTLAQAKDVIATMLAEFAQEFYANGYKAGLSAQKDKEAPSGGNSPAAAIDAAAQPAQEAATPPAVGGVFNPEDYRHIEGQHQKTLCGYEIYGNPQLEATKGNRVNCPLCLQEMN